VPPSPAQVIDLLLTHSFTQAHDNLCFRGSTSYLVPTSLQRSFLLPSVTSTSHPKSADPQAVSGTFWVWEVPALPCLASPGALRGGEFDPQGVVFPHLLPCSAPAPGSLAPPHICAQVLRDLSSHPPEDCLTCQRLHLSPPTPPAGGWSGNTSLLMSLLCASLVQSGGGRRKDTTRYPAHSTSIFVPGVLSLTSHNHYARLHRVKIGIPSSR
jgi:hypothetical protein